MPISFDVRVHTIILLAVLAPPERSALRQTFDSGSFPIGAEWGCAGFYQSPLDIVPSGDFLLAALPSSTSIAFACLVFFSTSGRNIFVVLTFNASPVCVLLPFSSKWMPSYFRVLTTSTIRPDFFTMSSSTTVAPVVLMPLVIVFLFLFLLVALSLAALFF